MALGYDFARHAARVPAERGRNPMHNAKQPYGGQSFEPPTVGCEYVNT